MNDSNKVDSPHGIDARHSARRVVEFAVEISVPDRRLDQYLRERFPAASRAALKRLIEDGHIRVDGKIVKATHSPRAGERVWIHWPEPKSAEVQPEEMALDILFEDDCLLVLNKPAGLVVHPSAGHEEHTLVNALLHHCRGSLSGIGGVARPGIVHRLDKETSGCLVVAKNDESHLALSKQFSERRVDKIYNAIVCGEITRDGGDIRGAIARHPSHRKRMAVRDDDSGRAAHTQWRVLKRLNAATWVEAHIFTGRTHQIRVHFQYLGHPLAGDQTYGARQNKRLTEITGCEPLRVMLHALKLSFLHPRTEKKLNFQAPLPEDFQEMLRALKSPA
ncbi:MAG TPA: RluA family pseudouridine synthase [Candidatus Sulfotelmatobacter sp.]|nr:RluA family pseudouridine synthase [Candidatus Sulfotelmatobacter sp.]